MEIDKSKFKDENGRFIVQGLFLEDRYNTSLAYYTTKDEDHKYKGRVYPSLKRLYIEEGDILEYDFANKYLVNWEHWQRIVNNKWLNTFVTSWRDELLISIKGEALASIIDMAVENNSYQAAKYLLDEGWIAKDKGRPSNKEIDRKLQEKVELRERFTKDIERMEQHMEKLN